MNEITKELLDALRDAEEALSHVENNLHVRVNPPTLGRMREAIAKAEAALAAPQPDADGWIPWAGSPVPGGTQHFVRFRDGEEFGPDDNPGRWFWGDDGGQDNIIAYRVVKP